MGFFCLCHRGVWGVFLLLDRLAHKLVKQLIFLRLFLHTNIWLWLTVLCIFGFLSFRHNRSGIHRSKIKAFHDTADFRCVLGTGDDIDLCIGVFVFPVCEDTVKHTVFFCFLSELL